MAVSYRFGTVEVRPAERRVLVAGAPAAIGARAFDLLVALIENRDRVMSKDELLALVWPGVVVEENNLQVQVSTLRKILGGEAVSTLPGRGYRFTLTPDGNAAPAPPRRDNLPAELTSFVGREFETAQLRELLRESRLVTLTGAGGTGKSRLSRHVAAAMLSQFPDGAWLVELAPLSDEGHVPLAVATALGIAESDLAAHVAGRQLLILLDNCEHLLRGCAEAARHLLQAGPEVRILATSREPLHVTGEATYRMQTLPGPHAIQLFVERARAANPSLGPDVDTSAAVAEICKRLDGMPLAIELAAARVRALSVARIAERLDDRFRLLTTGDATALPRQQTLRALIDWSFELLDERERVLFRRLAVFAGGFTLDAAESVCAGGEIGRSDVVDVLSSLAEKSLLTVEADGNRYRLLETMREYAHERLGDAGEGDAVRSQHLAFYLAFAEAARAGFVGPEQGRWLASVDLERENLLAAHRWCDHASDGAELGLRLVHAVKQYWLNRGLLGLGYRITCEALERAGAQARTAARCRGLFDAGQLSYFMGRYEDATRTLEESVSIARELDETAMIARVLQPLGATYLGLGNVSMARTHLTEALALAQRSGDQRQIAAAMNALAQLHRLADELDAAEPLYESVVDLARALGDRESVAIGLLNLAMVCVGRSATDRARELLLEVLSIAEDVGSKALGQSVLEVSAGLAASCGQWAQAARLFGAAEAQMRESGLHRDPADEAFLAPLMRSAQDRLVGGGFARAAADGEGLTYGAAVAEAYTWLRDRAAPVS